MSGHFSDCECDCKSVGAHIAPRESFLGNGSCGERALASVFICVSGIRVGENERSGDGNGTAPTAPLNSFTFSLANAETRGGWAALVH